MTDKDIVALSGGHTLGESSPGQIGIRRCLDKRSSQV
uniref:L-ascorbate peroxidase n=1 Tax=Aegilops tauschii subsp. strangulata TaxID=200361 RepID=A0A453AHB4_AEGTS